MTKHYTDEGTLLIRNSDIKDGKFEFGDNPIYLEKTFAEKNETRMHQIGDVITVHTGDVGTSAVITENEAKSIGFATIVTRPNPKIIDSNYLCSFLNTDKHKKWAVSISTGDGRTNYNLGDYFELVVPVPSIAEQKKIASYIQKLNRLITLHQRKCQIDGCRFQSPLAITWEQRKLGEIGSVSMCRRIFKEQTSENGEIPFYKIGTFGGEADAFISRELFEEYKAKYQYPKKGDILISASGSIGRTVVFTGKNEYFQDSNIVWLNHDKHLDNSFLKCFYSIVKWAGIEGSTIKRLYNDNILNTAITLPSVEEQQKIGAYFENLDNLITLHQREFAFLCKEKSKKFRYIKNAWEQRKLGDVVDVRSGKDYKHLSEGNIPVYGTGGFMLNVNQALSYDEDAIGIGRKGTIDKPYILKAPFWTVDTLFYAIPREKVDLNFAFDVFQNIDWKKKDESTGVPSLSKTAINEIDVLVPQYDEQQPLGQFFNRIDNLITLHQRKYDKLTNVKKSMLEKMFPQNGSNVPEIRFKGFTEAWEQRKLSEIATMHARIGWQNLRTSEFLDNGDYMLITGTDFMDGAVNFDTCHYVERERYEQDKHIQIRNGSILITKDGTLGKVAYIQGLTMPATLNAGVFNVEIRDEKEVDNRYLFQYLKAPFLMDYVDKKATGGTIKHLNQNILVDFPVVLPQKDEQAKIGEYFLGIDNLITLHQRELEKLKNLKKACLEKMFV